MKKIERVALSDRTIGFLWERRLRVVDAGDKHGADREAEQYAEAELLGEPPLELLSLQ